MGKPTSTLGVKKSQILNNALVEGIKKCVKRYISGKIQIPTNKWLVIWEINRIICASSLNLIFT